MELIMQPNPCGNAVIVETMDGHIAYQQIAEAYYYKDWYVPIED